MIAHRRAAQRQQRRRTCFDFRGDKACVSQLDASLTINSTAKTPSVRYNALSAAATWPAWTYGGSLTLQAGTAPTLSDGAPFVGALSDGVLFNAGGYWRDDATTTYGNVATDDFVVELVFRATGTTSVILAKRNAAVGWEVGVDASDRLYLTIEDAGGSETVVSDAIVAAEWQHAFIVCDRSGSGQIHLQGAASGAAVDVSAIGGTLNSTARLAIGADSGGNGPFDSVLAYAALWQGATWVNSHSQATVATERFYRLTGLYQQCKGTVAPVTVSRASSATVDIDRRLYHLPGNWMRTAVRDDGAGVPLTGLLVGKQTTNVMRTTHAFGSASWSMSGLTVTNDSTAAPDGIVWADTICEDNSTGAHYLFQGCSVTNAVQYTASVFCQADNRDWLLLLMNFDAANPAACFDVANGVVGTVDPAADDAYIEDWGGGWYRCVLVGTSDITASRQIQILVCEADNDTSFAGLTQDSVRMWGAQFEAGDYATTYIASGGGSTTRAPDNLKYKADDGSLDFGLGSRGKGWLEAQFVAANHDTTAASDVVTISDGGSSADRLRFEIMASGDSMWFSSVATNGSTGAVYGGGDYSDGFAHVLYARWSDSNWLGLMDGAGSVDTSVTPPDELDGIHIGANEGGALQLDGILLLLKVGV